MANTREIQSRMKSIQDTMKITNAMYMISSTKLRKARKSLEDTEPYFYTLQAMVARMMRHMPDIKNEYFDAHTEVPKQERKKGFIVVTADKGLAGAYNHNVLKMAHEQVEGSKSCKLFVVGELGRHYFAGKGIDVEEQFHYTAQNPTMHRARVITGKILDLYLQRELDEVYMIYTKMENSIQMETVMEPLLPLMREESSKIPTEVSMSVIQEEFILKPTPEAVIDNVVPNFVTGFVYGALVESFCSEQNSRMMAMEAANKSATAMIHDLSIAYNRIRQAMITQEITEVISGAKAQKRKKKHA